MSQAKYSRSLRLTAHAGLFAVVLAGGALFTTGQVGATSLASQISQLQSREAALRAQLAAVQGRASHANQEAAAAQLQVSQTQAKVVVDRAQLASLVTQLYQRGSSNSLGSAIADSSGISQFVDNTLQLQTVGQQFSQITAQLLLEERSLQTLKVTQTRQQQQVAALVVSLQNRAVQLQAAEAAFNAAAASLGGQAGQIAAQIQAISRKVVALQAEEAAVTSYGGSAGAEEGTILSTSGPPSPPYATPGDPYPWGQCTWYVATQTNVPWAPDGNADQWVGLDYQYGSYAVGMTPRAGSMVVFSPGGAYDPYYGHVAWVVAVLGPNSFVVREANFLGLGEVDTRAIYTLQGVEGFIYG